MVYNINTFHIHWFTTDISVILGEASYFIGAHIHEVYIQLWVKKIYCMNDELVRQDWGWRSFSPRIHHTVRCVFVYDLWFVVLLTALWCTARVSSEVRYLSSEVTYVSSDDRFTTRTLSDQTHQLCAAQYSLNTNWWILFCSIFAVFWVFVLMHEGLFNC